MVMCFIGFTWRRLIVGVLWASIPYEAYYGAFHEILMVMCFIGVTWRRLFAGVLWASLPYEAYDGAFHEILMD